MTRVLVPLAQGCEELEAVTIIDLLRRADIKVVAAGLDDGPVTASRGSGYCLTCRSLKHWNWITTWLYCPEDCPAVIISPRTIA